MAQKARAAAGDFAIFTLPAPGRFYFRVPGWPLDLAVAKRLVQRSESVLVLARAPWQPGKALVSQALLWLQASVCLQVQPFAKWPQGPLC